MTIYNFILSNILCAETLHIYFSLIYKAQNNLYSRTKPSRVKVEEIGLFFLEIFHISRTNSGENYQKKPNPNLTSRYPWK